jgi:purine-binding chemotaxis protein CheW
MADEDKFKELDPGQIIQEMREEYWREISSPDVEVEEDRSQVLVVKLSTEKFALAAGNCKTIVKSGRSTRVPRMPVFMLGVINLRGQIVSVVDLGLLLGLPAVVPGPKSRLVVVESGGARAAFLVDAVLGIEWAEQSRLREPMSVQVSIKAEYIKAHIAPAKDKDEQWVTFLDVDKIVQGPELFVGRKQV